MIPDLLAKTVDRFGPCFAEFKCLSLLYPHLRVLVLQLFLGVNYSVLAMPMTF